MKLCVATRWQAAATNKEKNTGLIRKNPHKAGFLALSYVLGGRLAPSSPVASVLNIKLLVERVK
jgi:hypothetical protein